MSHNLIRNYIIKIELLTEDGENSNSGTGVIFKSSKDGSAIYILTAKHIFDSIISKKNSDNQISLDQSRIHITIESAVKKSNIITNNVIIHLINNKTEDIAFIIIKKEHLATDSEPYIHYLEFFDMDDNPYERIEFFISGYPNHMGGVSLTNLMHYNLRYLADEKNATTTFHCTSSLVLAQYKTAIVREMKGISGAGIFVRKNTNTVNLSHIQHNITDHNKLAATRVDLLIDTLNDIISKQGQSFPPIRTSTRAIIDDISIEEFQDFNFLKSKISNDIPSYMESIKNKFDFAKKLESDLTNKEQISSATKTLKKVHDEITSLSTALSYVYANYAIIAHDNKSKRLTTLLFKKAIELNPEHKNTFLQEKARRDNDSKKLKELAAYSLEDTINFYDERINDAQADNADTIPMIKEAILAVRNFKDITDSPEKLCSYFSSLENAYRNNHTIREPYKYKELGEFYNSIFEKKKALKQFYISLYLLEGGPETTTNLVVLSEIKDAISNLNSNNEDHDQLKEEAQAIAANILEQEEDKNIKDKLNRANAMLSTIYDDIYHIKLEESKQKQLNSTVANKLRSLTYKIEEQINQNAQQNLNTTQINTAISILDTTTSELTENIKNITIQYDLKDEETREKIIATTQQSHDEINHIIDEFNNQSTKITHTINDHLDNLSTQENTLLQSITDKFDEKLQEINIHQKELTTKTHETLKFLKESEQRMLSNIKKFHLTIQQRDSAIFLIQESISQLQKSVYSYNIRADFRKKPTAHTNNTSDNLETIQQACLQMENRISQQIKEQYQLHQETAVHIMNKYIQNEWLPLTKQALRAHTETTSSIQAIHSSQNRFEHSLLKKTVEALHKYEKVGIKNHWTLGKKILFGSLIMVIVSAVMILLLRQGHLDFLIPLWHTALQKFNG